MLPAFLVRPMRRRDTRRHDELEPGASTNSERIEAVKILHADGFKIWASIEPIVDFQSATDMILKAALWCDLFKIGLMSGRKYLQEDVVKFINKTISHLFVGVRYYFKDNLLKVAGISRSELPNNCVWRDYNIFKDQQQIKY